MPARAEHPLPANDTGADLGNVVPFMRPRGNAHTAPAVVLPADAARPGAGGLTRERLRLAAFVTASLALHAGLVMALWREPAPLASIGLEVISVEIVLGTTAPAGVAPTQGEQQVIAAAAPETEATEVDKAEEKATAQPQTVEVAREETAPEQKTEQPKAEETKPEEPKDETAAAPQEPAQAEQKPAVAMVETPAPDTATAKPQETPPSPLRGDAAAAAGGEAGREEGGAEAGAGRAAQAREGRKARQGAAPHRRADARERSARGQGL